MAESEIQTQTGTPESALVQHVLGRIVIIVGWAITAIADFYPAILFAVGGLLAFQKNGETGWLALAAFFASRIWVVPTLMGAVLVLIGGMLAGKSLWHAFLGTIKAILVPAFIFGSVSAAVVWYLV